MLKKIALTITLALSLSVTPNKAAASIPISEIIEGAKLGKAIFDLTAPLIVQGIKLTTKISKKIVGYLKKKNKKGKDVYVNPLRIAALQKAEEREEMFAKLYAKSHKIDLLDEAFFK